MTLSYSRLHSLLLSVCGILLVALIYEAFAPIPEWNPPAASYRKHGSETMATYPFIAPSIEAFAEIDARPVFNPRRTPLRVAYDAASGTAGGTVAVGDLSLVGIIVDRGTKLALLRTPGRPLAVAVTVGAAIDGWQVVSIGSDRVRLGANGSEQELLLSANKAPPMQQSPAAARADDAQQ